MEEMTQRAPTGDAPDEAVLLSGLRAQDPLAFEQLMRLYCTRSRARLTIYRPANQS
jgi:hypothetical protein